MSGGSINYLCYAEDVINRTKDMEAVEQCLISLGYTDIATDVRRLIEYCKSAEVRINVLFEQLEDVFHDVEWYESADIGKATLIKTLEKYRNSGECKVGIANSATTIETHKYFSPEEVRKMTPKEVKANYDDIIQSMEGW